MAKYEVELTDTEDKAMSYCAISTQDWVDNSLKNRARIATKEIIALNVAHCNANGVTIATGEDAQVTQAFDLKIVKTAKEVDDEAKKIQVELEDAQMSRARDFADLAAAYSGGGALGKRNMVINGNMQVSQRATTTTGIPANSNYYPALDRYAVEGDHTAGRFTMSQAAITDLAGFTKAMKLDCTTADTSIGANEYLLVEQRIEGQNLQGLGFGTSDAKPVTVSFYVKGTAKTYMLEVQNYDASKVSTNQFAVTTSWNRISITIPADTASAISNDNGHGFWLNFWIHAGSTFTGGTYSANAWQSLTNNTRASGIGSFFSSTDNELYITGLQMELGEVATPFEHESYGDNLQRCQRYFYKFLSTNVYGALGATGMQINTNATGGVMFQGTHPVMMRAAPTMAIGGSWSAEAATGSTTFELAESVRTNIYTWQSQEAIPSSNASDGAAAMAYAENRADAFLSGSAELQEII